MAIEKNYYSTYGWEVPDAYYKVRDDYFKVEPDNDDDKRYQYCFEVFRNKEARDRGDTPLSANFRMILEIDKSSFDAKLSDDENFKTQMYEHLKNYTNSFKNDGKDV